jgi:transposase
LVPPGKRGIGGDEAGDLSVECLDMSFDLLDPLAALALEQDNGGSAALAPSMETFSRARDFAAWLGLTPRQRSTGGKTRLGHISKMGDRTLRRLLIIGASAVVQQASRRGAAEGSWLARMLMRKPRKLISVAQANKTARVVWAVLTRQEDYRVLISAES